MPFRPRGTFFYIPPWSGTSVRSSFLSRWSVAIYVRAIKILTINSAEGQWQIGFHHTIRVSKKEPKGNSVIRWKVRCFGEHASEFSDSGLLSFLFRLRDYRQGDRDGGTRHTILYPSTSLRGGEKRSSSVCLREGIRTTWRRVRRFPFVETSRSPNATYLATETNIGGQLEFTVFEMYIYMCDVYFGDFKQTALISEGQCKHIMW